MNCYLGICFAVESQIKKGNEKQNIWLMAIIVVDLVQRLVMERPVKGSNPDITL